jgi:hypothetical protein
MSSLIGASAQALHLVTNFTQSGLHLKTIARTLETSLNQALNQACFQSGSKRVDCVLHLKLICLSGIAEEEHP